MKVRTNLTPSELEKVSKGLKKLAEKQQLNEIELENPAEKELMRRVDALFDTAVNNLQAEVARILLDKED